VNLPCRRDRQHGIVKLGTTPGLRAVITVAPQDRRSDGTFGQGVDGLDPGNV